MKIIKRQNTKSQSIEKGKWKSAPCIFHFSFFIFHFLLLSIFNFQFSICKAQTSDSLIVNIMRSEGVTFSHDNSITLLTTGAEKFQDMFTAIRQARHSVHLEYFNFRNDSIANALFDLLA